MAARLSVIFYILLCVEVGIVLTVLPWYSPFGLGDWGSNYFLLYAAHKIGSQGLQHAVSSGWFRGAVTGLGLLNLSVAVWEIVHFKQTVRALQGGASATPAQKDDAKSSAPDHLPDNERQNETGQQPGQ
ncbi:MAG: hypothetical protein DMF68_06075 [Acidobacteria bacterium]|nr:MAG: hypothetical protein DMF68_06075 [Acidobacteriota bacterium]